MSKGNRCRTLLTVMVILLWATGAWALSSVEINSINLSFPQVTINVSTDVAGLPLGAFSVTDAAGGNPPVVQTLLPACFELQTAPVDIVFVVDISASMEDNIQAVADGIDAAIDAILLARPEISFRFGLVTYGQASTPGPVACPDALFYGGPRNRTSSTLWDATQLTNALNTLAHQTLQGGNEPAYHAVKCAIEMTPWRAGSEKKIVLVSDENNDWAMGSNATCNNDPMPFIALATVQQLLADNHVTFFAWCNYNVSCDGHDNGDGIEPENLNCGISLSPVGCTAGLTDFNPMAHNPLAPVGTLVGAAVSIDSSVQDLFDSLTFNLITTYNICYDLTCCVPGQTHNVVVTVTQMPTQLSDNGSYVTGSCPPGQAPSITCSPGNPTSTVYGEAVELCVVVTDGDNNLSGVTASYNTGPGCNVTVPAVESGGQWCVTVPGACTGICSPNNVLNVTFHAVDDCGLTDDQVCSVTVQPSPPAISCWPGNPTTFPYGTDLTLCATTADLLASVVEVRASYTIDGCTETNIPANLIEGRWCVTIPGSCTDVCGTASVTFTAYNECGGTASVTCSATATNSPPAAACFTGNPTTFTWGQPVEVCVTTADVNNNVTGVTASYSLGAGCVVTNQALSQVSGRWCITIPGSCTQRCENITVNFTVTDACGATGTTSCTLALNNQPPTVACATSNPATILYGAAATICATAGDPNNNLTGVTYSYNTGPGCSASGNADFVGGQYCVTIPAACTRLCGVGGGNADIAVTFTATDACGLTVSTICHVGVVNNPPVVTCWASNPASFTYGQALTMCAIVTDANANVTGVTASYNTGVAGCNVVNGPTTDMGGGRYCVTIPANCTATCSPIAVTFTATDACAQTGTTTCTAQSSNSPPTATCWASNPASVTYGTAVTLCTIVNDVNNNVTGVTASYNTGVAGCNLVNTPCADQGGGRWCVTIPANCTAICTPTIAVAFTVTDACGATGGVTCNVGVTNSPPTVACYTGNPASFTYGQPLTMCVTAADVNNNLTGVTASYNTGAGCIVTNQALSQVEGRWCITIPGGCTQTCSAISVSFTATDACGQTATTTCTAQSSNTPPTVTCYTGNPVNFQWGQPLEMCVLASDANNNLTSVTASYDLGAGCQVTNQALTQGSGRWCITIPGSCTDRCASISVTFTATDACGATNNVTCSATLSNQPPVIDCYVPADRTPGTIDVLWGQPVILYSMASDPNGNLDHVNYSYNSGAPGCDSSGLATPEGGGLYSHFIPGICTRVCAPFDVTFTAVDACGLTRSEVCHVNVINTPPAIECWLDNPTEATEGDAVTMCATVTDAESNVHAVWATYNGAVGCTDAVYATETPPGSGRWCFVVPENCTNGLGGQNLEVQFYVDDACGLLDNTQCFVFITPRYCFDLGDLIEYGTEQQCLGGPAHAYNITHPEQWIAWLGLNVDCDQAVHEDQDSGDQNDGLIPGPEGDLCEKYNSWRGCVEQTLDIFVTAGPGYTNQLLYLSAWYDGNVDGDWDDSWVCPGGLLFDEWMIQDVVVTPGMNHISVVLDNIGPNPDFVEANLRFRLGIGNGFGSNGYDDPVGLPCEYRVGGEVEDYHILCPIIQDCCFMCQVEPPVTLDNAFIELPTMNLVAQWKNNRMRLFWDAIPGAEYYQVYKSGMETPFEEMTSVGFVAAGNATQWVDNTSLANLEEIAVYRVAAYVIEPKNARTDGDRGRWEMNEYGGECTMDYSDLDNPACRPLCAEPSWGFDEVDEQCEGSAVGYMHFGGYRYVGGTRCAEHLEVDNDWEYYQNYFQAWTRIRIFEQPTVNTGPYYILSNNSFDALGGGFALRIDPGWYTVGGVRHYHNRLTGMVWNQNLNGGTGGWMTLQSPAPTPDDPDHWSVPLGQWSCICMVVNGNRSMLIIDGRVVAAGDLNFFSDNNNAPLIIGAGYRHSTYPIEYPFRGDIDCVRITSLD